MTTPHTRFTALLAPLRSSFRAKLLGALVLSVMVAVALALLVVRRETAHQIGLATERITHRSREAFRQLEQLQHDELARLSSAFTESVRTLAALEALLEAPPDSEHREELVGNVGYELTLRRLPRSLAAFTDQDAEPVLTLLHGEARETDADAIRRLAARVLEEDVERLGAYGVLGDELFAVQVQRLELDGRTIGTVVLGLPIDDTVAHRLGDALGVELCFVVGRRCLAGTAAARTRLAPAMSRSAPGTPPRLARVAGGRWDILSEPLTPERPADGWRTIALSVDEVLAPFDRIHRALLIAGALALGLALLLGFALARGLGAPVRELVGATRRVAGGEYTSRVRVRSADEIGQLADAFNRMTEGLELKERYRGVLDKVVSRDIAEELLRSDVLLGGETREVTTLFADITSFTTMTEGMAPQRVITLLNECMARLGLVVESSKAVVDKYLGDGLMALFGAPVHRPDDAAGAVRAALRMQEEIRRLSSERERRGEEPIRLSIGIDRGTVVAGNMGSPTRLNYTVVGESVNLAARLCAAAGPGEILVSDAVRRAAGAVLSDVAFEALGARTIRGFTRPVEVFAVREQAIDAKPQGEHAAAGDAAAVDAAAADAGSADAGSADTEPADDRDAVGPRAASRSGLSRLLVATLLVAAAPRGGLAQNHGGLPTLSDLGLHYRSPSGRFELGFGGRLDVEAFLPQDEPTWLIAATDPFVAGRVRLFTDVFAGDRVYGLLELRADRGQAPTDGALEARVQQAFARVALPGRGRVRLQAGKFALPIGGYPERHQTAADAFIRPPIMYDHRTIVAPRVAPAATAGFLNWKDEEGRRERGAPVLWAVPYPWGAMVTGSAGRFDARVALLSAAPSAEPAAWRLEVDRFDRATLVAAAGLRITPELRLNTYYGRGAFLEDLEAGALPPGSSLDDFAQRLLGAEAVFKRGLVQLLAEIYANTWQVPNVIGDVRDLSYSAEAKVKLTPGLFTAARFGGIRFNSLPPQAGAAAVPWDHDIHRLQLAAGYRIARNAELRAEYLVSRTRGDDPRDNLLAVQWWWAF